VTERFLSFTEVAALMGITTGGLGPQKMPAPDAMIGKTRGWRRETIEAWIPSRPGRGVGGGRPPKKSA